jgi:hypothetical protein
VRRRNLAIPCEKPPRFIFARSFPSGTILAPVG